MHESQVDDFNCQLLQGLAKTCPARRTEPKKPGIDAETWALRTQKLIARRGLREIARRRRNELLRFCMKSWKEPSSDLPHLFWQYDGWLLCLNVKILGRFQNSARRLRTSLKQCKNKQLQQAFDRLHPEAPASAILHGLKKVIGPTNLRAIKQQTLPMIQGSDGTLCTTPQQALDTWISFFQDMEGGCRVEAHQQRCLWIDNLRSFQATDFDIRIDEVPSLVELEMAFRHVKPQGHWP